jgi:hypothetical protein
MAIYGINFNNTPIPTGPAFRKFPKVVRRLECNHWHPLGFPNKGGRIGSYVCCLRCKEERGDAGGSQFVGYQLKGIGQSLEERNAMLITADNGHRKLFTVSNKTAGGEWYGIYVY